MTTPLDPAALDRPIAPVLDILTPDQAMRIADWQADWQADAALAERIERLADKANEGDLSDEARAEHEGDIRANDFAALHAKARRLLAARQAT